MKKLQFKVSINTPVTKIYDFMLGKTINQLMSNGLLCLNLHLLMKEVETRETKFYLSE